jgi:outer membrane lipoprotein SlyB
METGINHSGGFHRKGMLYPMLLIAAGSLIIFSLFGVAMMTGLLPRAESMSVEHSETVPKGAPVERGTASPPRRLVSAAADPCANCGVIESIKAVEVKGQGSGLGMAAGGITGALVGNQIGRGRGNTLATIAGAAGGVFAGNEIEKNMKKSVQYQIRVQMSDGSYRTTYQPGAPAFAVGDKVKVVNGQVVAAG